MSIPLVQKAEKDDINTSIIAIKRNIERINMLLGLSNSEEIDTSKFATKEELQQAVTDLQPVDEVAVDNMHSVTSGAVYSALDDKIIVRRKTITPNKTISALNYTEVDISDSDFPISISGYELISANAVQSADDAFLYNLHISNNHFRLTIFNCAPQTSQTTKNIYLIVVFRKLDI